MGVVDSARNLGDKTDSFTGPQAVEKQNWTAAANEPRKRTNAWRTERWGPRRRKRAVINLLIRSATSERVVRNGLFVDISGSARPDLGRFDWQLTGHDFGD